MKRRNGFTLIEMMLVIAVIAIIASLSIMAYQRHSLTERINKVSVEMQHVLEAALAYNIDNNGQWPEGNAGADCYRDESKQGQPFVENYIPNEDYQSSFGDYFCWSAKGENKKASLFWVALKISHQNIGLANRIAARLPNAIVTSDPKQAKKIKYEGGADLYVRSEVVLPAMSAGNNNVGGLNIVATGDCPSHNNDTNSNNISSTCERDYSYSGSGTKYAITFSACADQHVPRVTVFPNQIKFPQDNFPGFTVKDIDAERTNEPCTIETDESGQRRETCNVTVHATTCIGAGPYKCNYIDIANARNPGSVGASYTIACVPVQ